jgi:hypothetical protein
MDEGSGRSYARLYESLKRGNAHRAIEAAVERSGGRVVYSSGPSRGPLFLGIENPDGRPIALCAYVFTATHQQIRNRPLDEHRFQVRYGDVNSDAWKAEDHPVGFDPLGSDTTVVLGVHEEADLLIAVDPIAYDPLPMGISVFFKDAEVAAAQEKGWHVWERDNIAGVRREDKRTELGLETLVAFKPEMLFRYVQFERTAQRLGLDPPLRFRAAQEAGAGEGSDEFHDLERQFSLKAQEILDIIDERPRLGTAVRGGVAERHLEKALQSDPDIAAIRLGEADGPPDFIVGVRGRSDDVSIECKNASPQPYSDGTFKVETQKTRASKGDPKSRLYEPAQFDVVAACMYGPLKEWTFRYKRSELLMRDTRFEDRIAAIQRIDGSWAPSLQQALAA